MGVSGYHTPADEKNVSAFFSDDKIGTWNAGEASANGYAISVQAQTVYAASGGFAPLYAARSDYVTTVEPGRPDPEIDGCSPRPGGWIVCGSNRRGHLHVLQTPGQRDLERPRSSSGRSS